MHLNDHLIPRFRGDVDNPRGGVARSFPSKANFLREVPTLATRDDDPFSPHMIPLFIESSCTLELVVRARRHPCGPPARDHSSIEGLVPDG